MILAICFLGQQLTTWEEQETSLRFNTAQDNGLTLHNPIQTAAFPQELILLIPFLITQAVSCPLQLSRWCHSHGLQPEHLRASQSGAASPNPRAGYWDPLWRVWEKQLLNETNC